MKVALVHESLTHLGGAERVLVELHALFPAAPLYTLFHDERVTASLMPHAIVRPSFFSRLPRALRHRERLLLPLLPVVPETFDLSEYDVVVSSASAFAKGIVTRPGTLHICYCHSPTRYLWDWTHHVLDDHRLHGIRRGVLITFLHYLRLWDQAAARRVDAFVTNSEATRGRIQKYYGREAVVIYPPVDVQRFIPTSSHRGYFLVVSRLTPYKRVELVIQAFNKLELPLVIAGEGRERARLERLAGPHVTFRGFVDDRELPALYAGARAVLFAGEDDFGIVPVEAMASGKPVIAYRRGGVLESVIEGVTGEFFDEPVEAVLAETVRQFLEKEGSYSRTVIRSRAEEFSPERFRDRMQRFIENTWARWQETRHHGSSADRRF